MLRALLSDGSDTSSARERLRRVLRQRRHGSGARHPGGGGGGATDGELRSSGESNASALSTGDAGAASELASGVFQYEVRLQIPFLTSLRYH